MAVHRASGPTPGAPAGVKPTGPDRASVPKDAPPPANEVRETYPALPRPDALEASLDSVSRSEPLGQARTGPLRRVSSGVADRLGNTLVHLASRSTQRMGLDLEHLLGFERFFYTALRVDTGHRSGLLASLLEPRVAYVNFTGDPSNVHPFEALLMENAKLLAQNRYPRDPSEPPPQLPEQYRPIWERLVERQRTGASLVDFCDGENPSKQSAAHLMSTRMLGDAVKHRSAILRQVAVEDYLRSAFLPALAQREPKRHKELVRCIERLMPGWAGGNTDSVLGWKVSEGKAQKVRRALLAELGTAAQTPPTRKVAPGEVLGFADLVSGLAQKTVSGPQSCWLKLLRELPEPDRNELLRCSARATVALMLASPEERYLPLPGPPAVSGQTPVHDRARAMRRVLLRPLASLPPAERVRMAEGVWDELAVHHEDLFATEKALRALDPAWPAWPQDLPLTAGDWGAKSKFIQQELSVRRQRLNTLLAGNGVPEELRQRGGQYLEHLKLLLSVARLAERVEVKTAPGDALPDSPVGIGEYYRRGDVAAVSLSNRDLIAPALSPPQAPRLLGSPEAARAGKKLSASVVLEGGGGKGFAYPSVLGQMEQALAGMKNLGVEVDEYVGTSAGAITAALLAAGYGPSELQEVMGKLDFESFYADFVALMGGSNPRVGGLQRTGMFSTREMYRTMHELLSTRLHIYGRPVLFGDLPANLKIVATVVADDLPQGVREQLGITPEGKLVFSKETTPNFDVVAALTASAAVPGFFNAPTLSVWAPTGDGDGKEPELREYKLQLVDGGVLNNLPAAEASKEDGRAALLMLPVLYEGAEPIPGSPASGLPLEPQQKGTAAPSGDWLQAQTQQATQSNEQVTLTTLDFNPASTAEVDQRNAQALTPVAAALPAFLEAAHQAGYERAVLTLNLATPEQQPAPIVQGTSRAKSTELRALATQAGLPCMAPEEAQKAMRSNFSGRSMGSRLGQHLFSEVIGSHTAGQQVFHDSLFGQPRYTPPSVQLADLWEMARSVLSAKFVSQWHASNYLFEQE